MKKTWKLLLYIVGGAVGIWLTAKLLLPIGLPFLLGLLLARIAAPLGRFLHRRWRFPNALASFLSVTVIASALLGILWIAGRGLVSGTQLLVARLPQFLSSLQQPLAGLEETLLHLTERLPQSLSAAAAQWISALFEGGSVLADTVSQWLMDFAGTLLSFVPELILFLLTMLLSAYLFSAEKAAIRKCAQRWLPDGWAEKIRAILRRLKTAIGGYCKAQILLMLVTFGILSVGLLILKRPSALLLAVLIAAIDALPVFGVGSVLIPWSVISFLQGNSTLGIGLLIVYAIASLTRTMLEPRFLGRQIGLHPLLTLLSLYAGYRLFGIAGMILVPIGVILLKQIYELVESV